MCQTELRPHDVLVTQTLDEHLEVHTDTTSQLPDVGSARAGNITLFLDGLTKSGLGDTKLKLRLGLGLEEGGRRESVFALERL